MGCRGHEGHTTVVRALHPSFNYSSSSNSSNSSPSSSDLPMGESCLYLSGGQDGYMKLWDMRQESKSGSCLRVRPGDMGSTITSLHLPSSSSSTSDPLHLVISINTDRSIVMMDGRMNFHDIGRFDNHHNDFIYSSCLLGSSMLFSGFNR